MSCQNIVKCTQSKFALTDLTRICAHHDGLAQFIPSKFLTHMSGSQIWIKLIQIFLPDICELYLFNILRSFLGYKPASYLYPIQGSFVNTLGKLCTMPEKKIMK